MIAFDVNGEVFDQFIPKVSLASVVVCPVQIWSLIGQEQSQEERELIPWDILQEDQGYLLCGDVINVIEGGAEL